MPGILSNKMQEVYEFCVNHIFWIIGLCIICMVIMQVTKKANFTDVGSNFLKDSYANNDYNNDYNNQNEQNEQNEYDYNNDYNNQNEQNEYDQNNYNNY